ncbi:MTP-1 family protein [Cohnella luojiensis]|uniref:DUF1861 family protein n=1 Tax=Cohnella luojiensis TaxID=652876 RepID=A0A4Y8LRG5_9BACL|nr:DUF1861 family protein [Cohnella luojiensis]TFE23873.1 DUF1861 family protein [Cohnella luojiensis]
MSVAHQTKTCNDLLKEYLAKPSACTNPLKLRFDGVGRNDVYNITAPFEDDGEQIIAGRVESRESEQSEIVFFVEREGVWTRHKDLPTFALQDPFHTRIGGELIIGGVQTYPHPEKENFLAWRTVFYRGSSIRNLSPFFTGPKGMKDIRLIGLADGTVGVFTRPQGTIGGLGKIGFTRIASLDELTVEAIDEAYLFEGQFIDAEWGGANEAHLLAGGRIGVLGHSACYDERMDRHYYPMVFTWDPETNSLTEIELIAVRDDFLPGMAKRIDLRDVVFSGGLIRNGDGTAHLYAGIGDAEAHRITIPDPFVPFEAKGA